MGEFVWLTMPILSLNCQLQEELVNGDGPLNLFSLSVLFKV